MSVNKCIFVGNLTRQPELENLPDGTAVCKFGIACNEKYKDKQGNTKESVEYINVVAWRGLAEVCGQYLTIGKQVYVSGKMKTSSWEKDGVKHYRAEIHADEMQMLGSKSDSQQNQNQGTQGTNWGAQNRQQQNQQQPPIQHPQGCQCLDCVPPPF